MNISTALGTSFPAARGLQIIYVPTHANGNLNHPDCEQGFVMYTKVDTAFAYCAFWRKGTNELRTLSNAEGVYYRDLIAAPTRSPEVVDAAIALLLQED